MAGAHKLILAYFLSLVTCCILTLLQILSLDSLWFEFVGLDRRYWIKIKLNLSRRNCEVMCRYDYMHCTNSWRLVYLPTVLKRAKTLSTLIKTYGEFLKYSKKKKKINIFDVVSTRSNIAEKWLSTCPMGCAKFARYCSITGIYIFHNVRKHGILKSVFLRSYRFRAVLNIYP